MYENLEWYNVILFSNWVLIFDKKEEITKSFYKNWKLWVYKNEDPIEWCWKNINEVAPATYAIHFEDIKEMKKHKLLFEGIEKLRKAKNIKFDVDIPEECMWYFSFDGKLWYMLVQYRSIMVWNTDDKAILNWAVFDPEKFLQNIEKYTDKITKEEAQNLLTKAESDVIAQSETLAKQVKVATKKCENSLFKIKNHICNQIVINISEERK